MTFSLIFTILLAAIVGLSIYLLTRRQARLQVEVGNRELAEIKTVLSVAKADFEARREELRKSVDEARERENDAKVMARESDLRSGKLADELKIALEEKGRFQNEATRVQETRHQEGNRTALNPARRPTGGTECVPPAGQEYSSTT